MEIIKVPLYVHSGGSAPVSFAGWQETLRRVNEIFAQAAIQFTLEERDFKQFPGSRISREDDETDQNPATRQKLLEARLQVLREHPERLCIFMDNDPPGGGVGDFGVLLRLNGEIPLNFDGICHELGHTLCLKHTHPPDWANIHPDDNFSLEKKAGQDFPLALQQTNGDVNAALNIVREQLELLLDGDAPHNEGWYAIADTPYTVGSIAGPQYAHRNDPIFVLRINFTPSVDLTGPPVRAYHVDLRPDRSNIMSYFGYPLRHKISPQQITRIRSTLTRGSLSRVTRGSNAILDPPRAAVCTLFNKVPDNTLEVYDVRPDGHVARYSLLLHSWKWQAPENMGGSATGSPAVFSWGRGRLDLFVRWTDGSIRSKVFTNENWWPGKTQWHNLGGETLFSPVCIADRPGRLFVFCVGMNKRLYVNIWDDKKGGTWSGWQGLGGSLLAPPAVCSWGSGRVDIVATFTDNSVRTKYFNEYNWWPNKTEWLSLGGQSPQRPAIVSRGVGRLYVSVLGMDCGLYSKMGGGLLWLPSPEGWYSMGGEVHDYDSPEKPNRVIVGDRVWSTPLLLTPGPRDLQIFAVDMRSQQLIRKTWADANGEYGAWEVLQGHLAGPVTGAAPPFTTPLIIARACDGAIWYRSISVDMTTNWERVDGLDAS